LKFGDVILFPKLLCYWRHFQILYCGWKERQLRHQLRNDDSVKSPDKRHAKIQGPYCINSNWASKQNGHLDFYTLRKYYERDAAYLGLIKTFLQDCPQLILQLYILAVRDYKSLGEGPIGILLFIFICFYMCVLFGTNILEINKAKISSKTFSIK